MKQEEAVLTHKITPASLLQNQNISLFKTVLTFASRDIAFVTYVRRVNALFGIPQTEKLRPTSSSYRVEKIKIKPWAVIGGAEQKQKASLRLPTLLNFSLLFWRTGKEALKDLLFLFPQKYKITIGAPLYFQIKNAGVPIVIFLFLETDLFFVTRRQDGPVLIIPPRLAGRFPHDAATAKPTLSNS